KTAQVKAAHYDVIRAPIVTEKTTNSAELNKVTFEVSTSATKQQVKAAVQAIFNVDVEKVNIINVKGKVKRFRGRVGKRADYKKAVVSVAEGQTLDVTVGA